MIDDFQPGRHPQAASEAESALVFIEELRFIITGLNNNRIAWADFRNDDCLILMKRAWGAHDCVSRDDFAVGETMNLGDWDGALAPNEV